MKTSLEFWSAATRLWSAAATLSPRIQRFIRAELPTVERWDLLAYTNLGKPKYHHLDLVHALKDAPLLSKDDLESLYHRATEIVPVARWSGAT